MTTNESTLIEKLARAMRKARMERTGAGKAFDPEQPASDAERADAAAIVSALADNVDEGMLDAGAAELDLYLPGHYAPGAVRGMARNIVTAALRHHLGDQG